MKKKCWIYCGVKSNTSLGGMELKREQLKQYALKRGYRIVSFISENTFSSFVQCEGALEVLRAVNEKKMNIIIFEEEILDKKDLTIRKFIDYCFERGIKIEEVKLKKKKEKKNMKNAMLITNNPFHFMDEIKKVEVICKSENYRMIGAINILEMYELSEFEKLFNKQIIRTSKIVFIERSLIDNMKKMESIFDIFVRRIRKNVLH